MSRSTILQSDDFEVGMLICQHTGPTIQRTHAPQYGDLHRYAEEDKSATGIPLEVLALNLPFVVVLDITSGKRVLLDSRDMRFMRVDEAYVRALAPDKFDRWKAGKCADQAVRREAEKVVVMPPHTKPGADQYTEFALFAATSPDLSLSEIVEAWQDVCKCENCVRRREQKQKQA